MGWHDRQAKVVIDEQSGQRFIALQDEKTRLRILTEAAIDDLGDGSFELYRQKIAAWNDRVHVGGTPEAIRAIDFLRHATKRSRQRRTTRGDM